MKTEIERDESDAAWKISSTKKLVGNAIIHQKFHGGMERIVTLDPGNRCFGYA